MDAGFICDRDLFGLEVGHLYKAGDAQDICHVVAHSINHRACDVLNKL